jgi:hypothetical protein
MLLVKYTALIFEMRFEMFQIVMFLLSVPVTLLCGGAVLGFEDRVWVSDFSSEKGNFSGGWKSCRLA